MRRRFLKGLAATLLLAGGVVEGSTGSFADSKRKRKRKRKRDKHDDVLKYRQKKNILPFSKIRARVRRRIKGEIIGAEFEIKNGVPIYEFKYITPSGQVREIYVDARTGRVLSDRAG
jgi:uncharacterized membrane protein YkoI